MSWDGIQIDFNKLNGWKFLTIILAVVLIFYMWTSRGQTKELEQSILAISEYQKDSVVFSKTINALGQEVSTQKSIIVTKNKSYEKILLTNSELKELNHQIKINAETTVKDLLANYTNYKNEDLVLPDLTYDGFDTAAFVMFIDSNYIPLGTGFELNDQWYSLSGSVEKNGLNVKSLSVINKDEYNLGYKKKKLKDLFKDDILTLEVIHENPYTSTTALKNIELKPTKKWYQKTGFKIASGFIAGSAAMLYICK